MSAATVAASADPSPSTRAPIREPWPARLVALALMVVAAVLLGSQAGSIAEILEAEWPNLVFWTSLVLLVNLFPVAVGDIQFVVDMPILVAVALLYPPEVAALIAIVATLDLREVRRQIQLSRAIFNRMQIGLMVYLAGLVFQALAGSLDPWPRAVLGTAGAIAASYLGNVLLVSVYIGARSGMRFREAAARLKVGSLGAFLLTYLGHGALALILGRLFVEVGPWSVVMFLVPTLVARQMLVRSQELQILSERLRERERFLVRLLARIDDERRDERLRIAGELHDDVQQELVYMLMLGRLAEKQARVRGMRLENLDELVERSEASIQSLRAVIHDLRKSPLGRGGLIPTVQGLVRQLQLDWGVAIHVVSPTEMELPPELQVATYQIAREAILNALKHSQASQIRVELGVEGGMLVLGVTDDGQGFEPDAVDSATHSGLGLMQERVARVGGEVRIRSRANEGTDLKARFPLRMPDGELLPDQASKS